MIFGAAFNQLSRFLGFAKEGKALVLPGAVPDETMFEVRCHGHMDSLWGWERNHIKPN
jgi:hypothetical protein